MIVERGIETILKLKNDGPSGGSTQSKDVEILKAEENGRGIAESYSNNAKMGLKDGDWREELIPHRRVDERVADKSQLQ